MERHPKPGNKVVKGGLNRALLGWLRQVQADSMQGEQWDALIDRCRSRQRRWASFSVAASMPGRSSGCSSQLGRGPSRGRRDRLGARKPPCRGRAGRTAGKPRVAGAARGPTTAVRSLNDATSRTWRWPRDSSTPTTASTVRLSAMNKLRKQKTFADRTTRESPGQLRSPRRGRCRHSPTECGEIPSQCWRPRGRGTKRYARDASRGSSPYAANPSTDVRRRLHLECSEPELERGPTIVHVAETRGA
jgi:hypothetical protein